MTEVMSHPDCIFSQGFCLQLSERCYLALLTHQGEKTEFKALVVFSAISRPDAEAVKGQTSAKHCDLRAVLCIYCIIIHNVILLCAASADCLCQSVVLKECMLFIIGCPFFVFVN